MIYLRVMSKTNEQLMDLLLSIIGATHCIPSRVTCGIQFWEMTKEQYQDFLDSDDTKLESSIDM